MKERDKFINSNIFEGIVSFRAVLSSILDKTSDRKILKVYYDKENIRKKPKELSFLKAKSFEPGYELILTDKDKIDELTLGNSHGGLAFVCSDRTYNSLSDDVLENGKFFVMIEGIEDPYNFGYAIRSLYAAGVDGIVLSKRNWLGASGVVCRASAGASEQIPFYITENDDFVSLFKKSGYKIVCADKDNSVSMYDSDLKMPLFLVVGGEKRGISSPLLKQADSIVCIEYGKAFPAALSAASPASVLAFEVYRQNR